MCCHITIILDSTRTFASVKKTQSICFYPIHWMCDIMVFFHVQILIFFSARQCRWAGCSSEERIGWKASQCWNDGKGKLFCFFKTGFSYFICLLKVLLSPALHKKKYCKRNVQVFIQNLNMIYLREKKNEIPNHFKF